MKNEEIIETQKLIADMRNDLAVIADTAARKSKWWHRGADLDKLSALVSNAGWMLGSFLQLVERHRSAVIVRASNYDAVLKGLMILVGSARSERLPGTVAEYVPRIDSALAKIAQVLSQKATKTE